jgi:pimeloyl-ACP methyl ester carboxylesterase
VPVWAPRPALHAGVEAIRHDPVGFARIQWDTWSPPGWFDDDEFEATALSFTNPDWIAITLNAYRARFLPDEARDTRYDQQRRRLSEGLERWFTGEYHRVVLDGVGHFPHREAAESVVQRVHQHLHGHHEATA